MGENFILHLFCGQQVYKFLKNNIMISKIEIENVKGYGIPGKTINLNLSEDKINLCIAPNGFGKSSLAVAFESLNKNRLDVPLDNKHYNFSKNPSKLVLTLDDKEYVADDNHNDINSVLRISVIHNRTRVDYTKKVFSHIVNVNAFTKVEELIICNIPPKVAPKYFISRVKKDFGPNGKILYSIDDFLIDKHFLVVLSQIFDVFTKYQTKGRKELLDNIKNNIGTLRGNAEEVISQINDIWFSAIESEENYTTFLEAYKNLFVDKSKIFIFNLFYQLLFLWEHERNNLRALIVRAQYDMYKERINMNLHLLNTTGQDIQAVEKDNNLIIEFPHAETMSNGQRDVLTFAAELMIFKSSMRPDKKYLLIIDEVFDYLDDANTLAAQYYLSNIVNSNRGNIYIMLLTHLNPYTFRNYVFNPKMINEIYLCDSLPQATNDMKNFIAFREWLNPKAHPERKKIYDDISRDILHYNPDAQDCSANIASYNRPGVKSTWGNPITFRTMLISELNKYLSLDSSYDPYAVAVALRLKVEKKMYSSLSEQILKDAFIDTHTTNKKLDFCETNGIIVPDAFFIVNSIHNSADHLKKNPTTGAFEEKQMVYKLNNNVVRHIIAKIFRYDGHPITVDSLS